MIKEYCLTQELKEIKILERFVIDNIRNPALNIQHYMWFYNIINAIDEQIILNILLNNGEFSISPQQKEQPIKDQLYRHYDDVLIPIREFKKFIASNDYRDLLENNVIEESKLTNIQKCFKEAKSNYQRAFQFYALHLDCRSVEPPKEILTKIKNIQALAYKA